MVQPRPAKRARVTYNPDPASNQQRSYFSSRKGRGRRPSVKQLVRTSVVRQDYFFKYLKAFDDNGALYCGKGVLTQHNVGGYTYVNGVNVLPVYFYAPFHVHQTTSAGSTATNVPLRRLCLNAATGAMMIAPMVGQKTDGTYAHSNHEVENRLSWTRMGNQGVACWDNLKLNLWGAKNKSIRWVVEYVQALQEEVNPFAWGVDLISVPTPATNTNSLFSEHWLEHLRTTFVNPIATSNNMAPPAIRTLKKYVFDLDPIDSSDGDSDPHVKRVNLFHRWNRNFRFDWSTDAAGTYLFPDDYDDPTKNASEDIIGTIHTQPEFMKDIFVVLYATNYESNLDTVSANTTSASFDISARTSWAKVNG